MFVSVGRARFVRGLNTTQFITKRSFRQSAWTWWNAQTVPPLQTYGGTGSESSGFGYEIAVAYHAKDRESTKVDSPTGEDNYFVAKSPYKELYAGVTDGVGGWSVYGYDSCAISRELCRCMEKYVEQSKASISCIDLLDKGFRKLQSDKIVQAGGTTAVVARFSPGGVLDVANLGDSWCGVFRQGKLQFHTAFQTINFNTPYQLSVYPPEMARNIEKRGSKYREFTAFDADEYRFQLRKDDIVVLATDGVTDNICTDDMEMFLKDNVDGTRSLQEVTNEFVDLVYNLSRDENFPSVFSQELTRITNQHHLGGKEDDITVVVVKVT